MVRIFRHYVSPVKLTMALVDFLLFFFAVLLAEWARFEMVGLASSVFFESLHVKLLVPFMLIPIILGVGGYESEAISDLRIYVVRMLVALSAAAVGLSAVLFLMPTVSLWRSVLLMALLFGGVLSLIAHALFARYTDKSFLARRTIILGAGKMAAEVKSLALRMSDAGLNIISVVSLSQHDNHVADAVPLNKTGDLEAMVQKGDVELIIVAADETAKLPVEDLIACKLSGVNIQDRLSFFEQVRGYVDLQSVKSEWIIFSDGFKGGSEFERFIKRVSDVLVSSFGLCVFLPFMILAGVAIAVTSKGPIFYRQERVGLNGKKYNLLKFRSMTVEAEKDGNPQWAKEADPRVTRVGGFLRRTRIDELPQVMNVLTGDMSFVGPRPERPFFVEQLEKEIPFYKERHCLKPGITGWAQIQYPYGASVEDSKRKLEYDLYYIKNYSIFLDLLIILQTIRVILFPVGVR